MFRQMLLTVTRAGGNMTNQSQQQQEQQEQNNGNPLSNIPIPFW